MIIRTRCIAVLGAISLLAGAASADAAIKHGNGHPVKKATTQVARISAFPAGGKGSGTEATCNLWSKQLQSDKNLVDNPPKSIVGIPWGADDQESAQQSLNDDVNNAMDAGCAVID